MWVLLHAWREWLAGHDITHLRVFGIEIRWWGRIGKALEFLGGLTVVIDLLGRERMEMFHATLRRRRTRLLGRWRRNRSSAREMNPVGTVSPASTMQKGCFVAGTVAVGLFIFVTNHYANDYAGGGELMPPSVLVPFIVIAAPTLGGLVLGQVCYVAGLFLLEAFVVTTLGQLATRKGLESRLKWIGLWIFVFGFSMDLLSS
jgi:hypothetical protein